MLCPLPMLLAQFTVDRSQALMAVCLCLALLFLAFVTRRPGQSSKTESKPGTNSLTLLGAGAAYPFSIRGRLGEFKVTDVENLVVEWAQNRYGKNKRPVVNPWVGSAMAPLEHPPYDNVVGYIIQGTICLHGEDAVSVLRDLATYVARQLRATQVWIVHVGPNGTPQQFVVPVAQPQRVQSIPPPPPEVIHVP